jgi:hypothetical protein
MFGTLFQNSDATISFIDSLVKVESVFTKGRMSVEESARQSVEKKVIKFGEEMNRMTTF